MNENEVKENLEKDPMATDVSDVDTSFPLLQDGRLLRFEIRKPKVADAKASKAKPLKEGETIRVLTVPCHTTDDNTGTKNEAIKKGFPVYHRITITETTERGLNDIAKNIALLCKACGLKGVTPRDVINNPTVLDGLLFEGKVKIMPEKDGFPASNVLSPVIPG